MVDLPDLATRMEILKVTLSRNRVSPDIDFKELAESLDGFTGSDIREVCREAVVRVAHERAKFLETGIAPSAPTDDSATSLDMTSPLRPVSFADFKEAMKKMKASVDDNGRELQKVVEWNEKFGEIKKSSRRQNKASSSLSMYM